MELDIKNKNIIVYLSKDNSLEISEKNYKKINKIKFKKHIKLLNKVYKNIILYSMTIIFFIIYYIISLNYFKYNKYVMLVYFILFFIIKISYSLYNIFTKKVIKKYEEVISDIGCLITVILIIIFSSININLVYSIIPYIIAIIIIFYKKFKIKYQLIKNINNDILVLEFRLLIVLQYFIVVLKIENILDWKWNQVLWPLWVIGLILILLDLVNLIIFISKIRNIILKKETLSSLIYIIMINYLFTGFTFLLFIFLIDFDNIILSINGNNSKKRYFNIIMVISLFYFSTALYIIIRFKYTLLNYIAVNLSNNNLNKLSTKNNNINIRNNKKKITNNSNIMYKDLKIPKFVKKISNNKFIIIDNNNYKKTYNSIKKLTLKAFSIKNNVKSYRRCKSLSLTKDNKSNSKNINLSYTNNSKINKNNTIINSFESVNNNELCEICLNNKKNSIFMLCSHGGLCIGCCLDLFYLKGKCYMCNNDSKYILEYIIENNDILKINSFYINQYSN